MVTVYILYSKNINKYYIGSCLDLALRIQEHISKTQRVYY
ncbi:GIY-YIG nuclease family protein [uncultured Dokdonia sp.]